MIEFGSGLAVVTGASSGLGALTAQRLAQRGMRLLLTGRDAQRLGSVAHAVAESGAQLPETLVVDLASSGAVEALVQAIGGRPVEVLVNNAGFATYGQHVELPAKPEIDLVAVNCAALVALTRALLPGMVLRGHGGVLNVASTIAFQPAPHQAVYGATKAFVLSYSQALADEVRGTGVAVTAVCPGPTRTNFLDAMGTPEAAGSMIYGRLGDPGRVVDRAIRGLEAGRAVVVVGRRNALLAQSARVTPRAVLTRVSGLMLRPALPVPNRAVPITASNEITVAADPAAVWAVLADPARWPEWYAACRWVRGARPGVVSVGSTFRWKAHPVVLSSRVTEAEPGRVLSFTAESRGLHAVHSFVLVPDAAGTRILSTETQRGVLPWAGRRLLGPALVKDTQRWLEDLHSSFGVVRLPHAAGSRHTASPAVSGDASVSTGG